MNIKERILETLKKEVEPLNYRYTKSQNAFKLLSSKEIGVYLSCHIASYYRGITYVNLDAYIEFRDIKKSLKSQSIIENLEYWHLGISCRLQWMRPEVPGSTWDFVFYDDDTEEIVNQKLEQIISCTRIYLIPYLEKFSHKDSALEETISLDKRFLVADDYLIPIMYCIWKHDKKAALDYLEERGMRLRKLVKPEEWDRLERTKKGEKFMQYERPINALAYEEYIEGSKKIREWIESQEYDD